jgi:hypothetical protein
MLCNKIILIGILLTCIPTVLAWDSESGYADGEEIELEYVEGYNYFTYTTPDKSNWYDPLINLWIRIMSYLVTDEEIEITVTTTCMEWDGDSYEVDTDTLPEEYGMTLDIPANQTGTTNIKIDPIEEFFKNNTNAVDDFTTRDNDPEHPDVLNVTIDITGAGMDVHETGYTSLNDAALDSIKDGIETPDDYGFATSGRGSDAGSGGIYTGLNIYSSEGDGTAEGIGDLFTMIFYTLIPILFIICVFKFISKAMSK